MADADPTNVTAGLIASFEGRGRRLSGLAGLYLVFAAFLLVAAGFVIIYAPSLTAFDIRLGSALGDRLKEKTEEANRIEGEFRRTGLGADIEMQRFKDALSGILEPWVNRGLNQQTPKQWYDVTVPCDPVPRVLDVAGSLAVKAMDKAPENPIGIRLAVCGLKFSFKLSVADYIELQQNSEAISLDPKPLNDLLQRKERLHQDLQLARDVEKKLYDQKVAQLADEPPPASQSQRTDRDVIASLVQTTVTRFGLLAVIGFFVGLLVSLYRYNVRLAAFYVARADFLRISPGNLSASDAAVLLGSLTPNLEFGKSPQLPLAQLVELMKSVKP